MTAASTLFAEHGVNQVSMAQIAERAGLRQASLYYWFASKEQILSEILKEANRVSLDFVRRLAADTVADPSVQLWRLIRFDVEALCTFPFDINEVHRLSPRSPDAFAVYWHERAELIAAIEQILGAGIEAGSLRKVDPRIAALTVLGNDEGSQNWFRPVGGRRMSGREERDVDVPSVAAIACYLADTTVAGLLRRSSSLSRIRREAMAIDAEGVPVPARLVPAGATT
jgi:TetR/AcrR family transcriptional regulator